MNKIQQKRDICYDILRSIVIVNAIILHFDTKFNISFAAYPFKILQNCFFTVGAFFFFTAGVMAHIVYAPRFKANYTGMTKKLIIKGIKIYAVYFIYLLIMNIAVGAKFEGKLIDFLFRHDLFLKVLFTFGSLYICAPLFLFLTSLRRNNIYLLSILTILLYIVSEVVFRDNVDISMLLFDRQQFLYPLLPSFLMFFLGMIYGIYVQNRKSDIFAANSLSWKLFCALVISFIFFAAFNKLYFNLDFLDKALIVILRESLVIVFAISCIKSLFNYRSKIRAKFRNWRGICFGVKSLTAYVTGNILIGLINAKFNFLGTKLVILFTVLWGTYLVSYWSWAAGSKSKPLVKSEG